MKKNLLEPLGLLVSILLVLKLSEFFLPASWVGVLTPSLLLYVPLLLYMVAKRPITFIDRSWEDFFRGVLAFWIVTLIVFPPYLVAAHYWMLYVYGFKGFQAAPWLPFAKNGMVQVLLVALPEEFFFRGYFQERLSQVFRPQWRILGVELGWGWVVTAVLFAFAHSVIQLKWWHFSIFFPALLFGYLKERTGSITASILFHAFCNCFTGWFLQSYLR